MGFKEKRKYVRLNKVFPVELEVVDLQNKPISALLQGFTCDVSFEGVCVEINNFSDDYIEDLKEQRSRITLYLNIPSRANPVKAVARLAWWKKTAVPYPQTYLVGMAYEVIDKKEQERIINYAKRSRILPWVVAGCCALLIFLLIYLKFENIKLIRDNQLLIKDLTQLSDKQFAIKKELDRIEAEKLIVARILKNSAQETDNLKNRIFELAQQKEVQEKDKNSIAIAKLMTERQELEQRLAILLKERSQWEEKLGRYDSSEAELNTKLAKIEDRKIVLEDKSLKLMYQWLVLAQNRKTGLVLSYDDDPGFIDVGFTYDQALSSLSFMHFGEHERAQRILDFFKNQAPKINNGFANAYDITNGKIAEYIVHSGPSIYLGLAMLSYEDKTKNLKYRDSAQQIGDWLLNLQRDNKDGAVPGGPGLKWTSTEHNITAYVFLDKLFKKTKIRKYNTASKKILAWLERVGYNDKLKRFNRGGDDFMIATDTVALSIMAFGPQRLKDMGVEIRDLIDCIEKNCKTQILFRNNLGREVNVTGFDFCSPSSIGRGGVISVEWTAQMVVAFKELNRFYERENDLQKAKYYRRKANYYFGELGKLLLVRSSFARGKGSGGLPYATDTGVDTGHGWYTPDHGAISASGTNFAIFAQEDYNMFKL